MRLLFVSYSLLPPIALSFPIIFSTLAHSVSTLVSMKHVACGAAPSAALFSAIHMIPPSLITKQRVNIGMAATVWSKWKFWLWQCQNNLESGGAGFGKMSAVNCNHNNKGGSLLWPMQPRATGMTPAKCSKYFGVKWLRLEGVGLTRIKLFLTFSCAWKARGIGLSGSGSAGDCAIAALQYVSLNRLSWTSASVFLTLSPYIKSQMWPTICLRLAAWWDWASGMFPPVVLTHLCFVLSTDT